MTPLPAIRRAIRRTNERTQRSSPPPAGGGWRNRLIAAGAAAVAVAGGLVIFGGGSEEETGFVASADAICRDAAVALAENQALAASSVGGVDAKLERELAIREEAMAGLEALGNAPTELGEAWGRHLTARQLRIALVRRELRLINGGTEPGSASYVRLNAQGGEASEAAVSALSGTPFTACAFELSREAEDEAVAVVKDVETEPLPDCAAVLTEHAMIKLYGGAEECAAERAAPDPEAIAESVDVIEVRGVDEAAATVQAVPTGGPRDGSTVMYALLVEDGAYKVNNIIEESP